MKTNVPLLFFFLVIGIPVLQAQFPGGAGEKLPATLGKSGPLVAVFHGGRPWQGNDMASTIRNCGCQVVPLTSVYLDGHGGATIKAHMGDKEEPKAFDGITPVFRDPTKYAAFFFHLISSSELNKIFTSERIQTLRAYIEQGGHVIFDWNAPAVLGDILPVNIAKMQTPGNHDYTADLPKEDVFSFIPGNIPVWNAYREAVLLPGAVTLSTIRNEKGESVAPFLAQRFLGKGSVIFVNARVTNPRQIHDFSNWAYSKAFFMAVIKHAIGGNDIQPDACITKLPPYPERVAVTEKLTVEVQPPKLDIVVNKGAVKQTLEKAGGRIITFPNGIVMTVDSQGNVSVAWNNQTIIRHFKVPDIGVSKSQAVFDSDTAEAVDVKEQATSHKILWQLTGTEVQGNQAVLRFSAADAKMDWIFTSGELQLDGRTFQGFAEHVVLHEFPQLVSNIVFSTYLTPPAPLFARRNSCYSPPRGYTDFDMTGSVNADTSTWGAFGSGQPFELIACENGVYLAHVDAVEPCILQIKRKKDSDFIQSTHTAGFGRMRAPIATQNYWRWFAEGAERPNHAEYLAMYQFLRQRYRRQNGLKELPGYPNAGYGYQLTKDEIKTVIRRAAALGYRFAARPNPESPIERIADPSNLAAFEFTRSCNLGCWMWTAGGYVQGDGGWIINNRPEWFMRDENNKLHQYFGKYPVIDINHPEFYDWYTGILKKAFASGLSWVYRDMDGAAAGGVNYAKETSPSGLYSLVKFYRFFHENNARVSVEGMNPLVLDEYWYRPRLYTSFVGNEFSLIGQVPSDSLTGGITLDPFRTGMFACFMRFEITGSVFGIERIPGELERIARTHFFVPKFNEALDICGMPYVRETPFGTTWIGDNGGALFFWNPAKEVKVILPEAWQIRGVKGNVLKNVPPDSIFFIDKK